MADRRNADAKTSPTAPNARGDVPARHVANAVVHDIMHHLDPQIMARLHSAVLASGPQTLRALVKELVGGGVRAVDLADHYIPEIARALGERWCVDETSFADVTIGVSRLQGILRSLGPQWAPGYNAHYGHASVLLVVPQDVHHTLGVIVLGGQLRRKGYAVRLLLGGTAKDVVDCLSEAKYDSVFISSSRGETLESLRKIVDAVKSSIKIPPPIVVGGSILEVETVETLTALTGADYATRIPEEALKLCGLHTQTHHASHQQIRG